MSRRPDPLRDDPDSYDAEASVSADPLLAELWLGFGGDADDCRRCGGLIEAGRGGAYCARCAAALGVAEPPRDPCDGWWAGARSEERVACAARALAPRGVTRCAACDKAQERYVSRQRKAAERAELARLKAAIARDGAAPTRVAVCMQRGCEADTGSTERLHCLAHSATRAAMQAGPGEHACPRCGRSMTRGTHYTDATKRRWTCPHCAGPRRKSAGGASPPAAEAALLRFARSFFRGGESA